ncbi:MAG TPA: hypothetical protein VL286_00750 [Rhizomicrobium sp.]|nr:hypothetical protein [Rhizomicrobium sp.]
MNARTQITLDPQLQRRAQRKAADLGISFAEYVRRIVANDLGKPKPRADISVLFDLGASAESTDVARDKDHMVAEAVWKDHLKGPGGRSGRAARRTPARPKRRQR